MQALGSGRADRVPRRRAKRNRPTYLSAVSLPCGSNLQRVASDMDCVAHGVIREGCESAATGFHDHRWRAGFWGQVSGVRKRQCGRHRAFGAPLMGLLLMG
jgi:hypothetical protein